MNQAGASKQSLVMEQAGTRFFFWMVIHSAFLILVKERCFSNAKCFFLLSNKHLHVENRLCSCFFSPDLLRKQKATSQSG